MLATENWCLKVKEKVYGPYTTGQMRKFAHEGRLASWSMIAPAGSRAWREARTENIFANFFGARDQAKARNRTFGKRSDWAEENPIAQTGSTACKIETANSKTVGLLENTESREPRIANFIIIFDVVNSAASRVEAAIMSLGQAFRITDNVFSVTCELTTVGVRNAIAPYLRSSEPLLVIDATRGRTSWHNYGPEIQAKISAAYLRTKVA